MPPVNPVNQNDSSEADEMSVSSEDIEETPHRSSSTDSQQQIIVETKTLDLDDVLAKELGQFGRFQLRTVLLLAVPIMMSAFMNEYIFSAAATPHRCQIHECGENSKSADFDPVWIRNAIPESSSGLDSCQRFAPYLGLNGTLDYCPPNLFNTARTIFCHGFVYASKNSVVYDFDLGCNDIWVSLAGTLNSAGTLTVMPFVGYLSDRFGRRVVLVVSAINMAVTGLIRAFSVNYYMYLTLQILQTLLSAGIYSAAYILAIELVGPRYRVMTSALCSAMFAVGQMILGGVAWLVQPWRYMIMALHIPCFLIVAYFWLLPESVRWQLAKQRFDEAKNLLERIARTNKKHITDKSLKSLLLPPFPPTASYTRFGLLKAIWRSREIRRRVFTITVWWISAMFVYYGLTISSEGLSSRTHLNYALGFAVEIPGYYIATLVLDKIGRKPTLSCGYFLGAACNIAFAFINTDLVTLRLMVYLVGKICVSVVLTSLYLYTIELYPTAYRHTFLAYSSMVGRLCTIVTPLIPLMMESWTGLPFIMFSVMGLAAGLLVLTQPETMGRRMPDTLQEAEAIGQS